MDGVPSQESAHLPHNYNTKLITNRKDEFSPLTITRTLELLYDHGCGMSKILTQPQNMKITDSLLAFL